MVTKVTKPDADPKITRRQSENARATIRTHSLLQRLHENSEGKLKCEDCGKQVFLSAAQVKSIQILLDKSLPTLQSIDSHIIQDKPELSPQQIDEQMDLAIIQIARSQPARFERICQEAKQGMLRAV